MYIVKEGDSLLSIAKKNSDTIQNILITKYKYLSWKKY